MQYVCDHLRCWCTDGGVESKSIEIPDCLEAFLCWIAGRALADCAHLVKWGHRLFKGGLRILGWNHVLGNIMKRVAKSYRWWPEVLENIRLLCRFFRNSSWKEWLNRALGDRLVNAAAMVRFTASLAKWRFQCVADSLAQLVPLREICETGRTLCCCPGKGVHQRFPGGMP